MLTLQVFIENQQVELYKDESITFTQTIQDVKDIDKVFTDFTRTFTVPATKTNNKIFKHFYNPHIIGFDARTKKPAELFLNFKLFKKGRIKLEGAVKKDNKPSSYKITFFGDTIKISDLIGEDKLANLSYLQRNFTFEYTNANIKTYMADGLDVTVDTEVFKDAIIFPLITHTKRLVFDSGTDNLNINTDTTNNVAYQAGHSTPTNYGLQLNQLKPALRLLPIIKAIEVQYGIEFSDDFFDIGVENFAGLYLWLHNKTGDIFEESEDTAFVTGFTADQKDFKGNTILNDNTFDTSGNRDGLFIGDRDIDRLLNISVKPHDASDFNVLIYKDGKLFKRYDNVDRNDGDGTNWNIATKNRKGEQYLNLGDGGGVFSIAIQSDSAGSYEVTSTVKVRRRFRTDDDVFTGTATIGTDQTINTTRQIPDIKVMDFLRGIFKMFNLTAFLNEDGIIQVKTLDQFYASSTKIWDITKHIDKDSSTVDSVLPYNFISLKYKGLKNFFAAQHLELFQQEWGTAEVNISRKYVGQPYTIELPFEHFKFSRLRNITGGALTPVQFGWSADISQEATKGEPLIFYAVPTAIDIAIINLDGSSEQYNNNMYLPSNSIRLTDSFNINFKAESNEYDPNGLTFDQTLFQTYYANYIKEIFEKSRRLTTTHAFLPLSMLMEYTLADKVRIFDQLFKINKVQTNFETQKSVLELLNIRETIDTQIDPSAGTETPNNITSLDAPPNVPDKFKNGPNCITVDTTNVTADSFKLRADMGCNFEGEEVKSIAENIPLQFETGNNPVTIDNTKGIEVTKATIVLSPAGVTTATSFMFYARILKLGKSGMVGKWSEKGFFYSADASSLNTTDYDILKARTGVTHVPFYSTKLNENVLPTFVSLKITGQSPNTTLFYRAYIRTEDDPNLNTDQIAFTKTGSRTTKGSEFL